MSLINKMLQDLDARGTTRAGGVPPEIKAVGGARRLPVGRIAAITGGVLLALGAAAWMIFPLKGKTYDVQPLPPAAAPAPAAPAPAAPVTVAEVAPPQAAAQVPAGAAPAAPGNATVEPPAAPVEEQAAPALSRRDRLAAEARAAAAAASREKAAQPVPKAAPEAQAAGSATSYAVASARARAEQDRLEKRWEAEEVRLTAMPPAQRAAAERRLRDEQARAAVKARQDTKWLAALQRREAAGGVPSAAASASAAAPAPAPAAGSSRGQGRVETESQGADNAYRRALAALQDGRTGEAVSSLQAALRANPRHEAARQTLVSLLIENNRGDEAMAQLQQALTLEPRQPALAMLLARLQIERGKSGIEALLRTLPYATGNGDYHAFLAGALQRQNRSREAAEQYQTALRTAPNNAVWWMGLGIALQGDKRNAEAQDAFRQAKALGTLSPELQAFVERRLAR
jgi:MSHA biogenesis protein MshN